MRALRVIARVIGAHLTFDDLACLPARDVEARALFALISKLDVTDIDSIVPVNIRQQRIAAPQRRRNMHPPLRTRLTDLSMYPGLGNLVCRT